MLDKQSLINLDFFYLRPEFKFNLVALPRQLLVNFGVVGLSIHEQIIVLEILNSLIKLLYLILILIYFALILKD